MNLELYCTSLSPIKIYFLIFVKIKGTSKDCPRKLKYKKDMRITKYILINTLLLIFVAAIDAKDYCDDILGGEFKQLKIELKPDYEGGVVATLVKYCDTLRSESKLAALYIHGYNDYFFQREEAEVISGFGLNFYALDLRKYGRSILPHQTPFNVRNIEEYYQEIDAAIDTILSEGSDTIYLIGHSTGGLIATLYVHDRDRGERVSGLILNSPFYEQNQSWFLKRVAIPIVSFLAKWFPDSTISQSKSTAYAQSLHKSFSGSWDYNLNLKLPQSPPVTYSWLSAIYKAQNRVAKIEDMPIKTLLMHSDKSSNETTFNSACTNSDIVLNVDDIERHAKHMGDNIEIVIIPNAIHDIALSQPDVRDRYYYAIEEFINR